MERNDWQLKRGHISEIWEDREFKWLRRKIKSQVSCLFDGNNRSSDFKSYRKRLDILEDIIIDVKNKVDDANYDYNTLWGGNRGG